MTTRRDLDRSIAAWLVAEAPGRAPDDVLEASRERLRTTRQRRLWMPVWRSNRMNIYAKLAAAAAAVLVVAVVGYQLLPGRSGPGTTASPATPTATPVPTEVPRLPGRGSIQPGTYRVGTAPTFLVTVPAGWAGYGDLGLRKNADRPTEVAFDAWSGIQVFADACDSGGTEAPIGPTAADLLAALRAQENSEVSDPVEVSVGGLPGMRLDISAPASLDVGQCDIGSLQIWVADEGEYFAGAGSGDPPGISTVVIVDTTGGLLAFDAHNEPGATAADIAELDAIVESITIVE